MTDTGFPVYLSDTTFSVLIDGRVHQTDRSNANWDAIKEALNDPTTTGEQLINLISPVHAVTKAFAGQPDVRIEGNHVYYGDEEIHNALADRLLDVVREGFPADAWVAFAQNVYANPWVGARDELYTWLEKSDLPITPDGCLLGYKVVRSDYKDDYSGTISNKVGETVVMPGGRDAVDPNNRQLCSVGLHFCSRDYLSNYGVGMGQNSQQRRVVIIKVNPADVVSVPSNEAPKARCWRYEVVGEIAPELAGLERWGAVATQHPDVDWADDPEGVEPDDNEWHVGDVTRAIPKNAITTGIGIITAARFANELAAGGGTLAGMAKKLGVGATTVGDWKRRLNALGANL